MEHNLYDSISAVATIVSIVLNDDTEGTGVGVDLQGYETAVAIVNVGISGDTLSGSVFHTIKLQESDALGSGYADVAAADMEGTQGTVIDDPAEDPAVVVFGYKGAKRFIRVIDDVTGTHTNGTPFGAVVVRSRARHIGGIA